MGSYSTVFIDPDWQSPYAEARRGGRVRVYHPDRLMDVANSPSAGVAELVGDITARLAAFGERVRRRPLPTLFSTLLKSESIASSMIEGYVTPPRDVLLAEYAPEIAGRTAGVILGNIRATRTAVDALGGAWSHETIDSVHHTLLPQLGPGYRRQRVWIGGRTILHAAFVPPDPAEVEPAMADLIDYANRGGETVLTKSAVIHAQFETIHPYIDGNGRAGRALVHGLLHRSGIITGAVLPISTILKARSDEYVAALTAYRYDGVSPDQRIAALDSLVEVFATATDDAITVAERLYADTEAVEQRWRECLADVRRDALAHRILALLPDHPVLASDVVATKTGGSPAAISGALDTLVDRGILQPARGRYRRMSLYVASELLNLLVTAERASASVDLDTSISGPRLDRPAAPEPLELRCGLWMPRKRAYCVLPAGHGGRCRSARAPGTGDSVA